MIRCEQNQEKAGRSPNIDLRLCFRSSKGDYFTLLSMLLLIVFHLKKKVRH